MKNLRFNHSENSMKLVPRRIETQLSDNGDGVLRKSPIVRDGYKAVPDDNDRQILKVRKEDLEHVVPALRWRTGQGEVDFSTVRFEVDKKTGQSKIIPHTNKICEIRLPGNFTPSLSVEDVSEIVQDFKLLGEKFPVYRDIFKKKIGENALQTGLIAWILEAQREIIASLPESKRENITKMPAWIARVLELRKGSSKNDDSGYGWE